MKRKVFSSSVTLLAVLALVSCGTTSSSGTSQDSSSGDVSSSITVVNPESITIAGDSHVLQLGTTLALSASVLPAGAEQSVNWSSTNSSIATVSEDGLVSPVTIGEAVIRATSTVDSSISADYNITVIYAPAEEVIVPNAPLEAMWVGESLQLEHAVTPAHALQSVVFESTNEAVATVSETGLIEALAVGTSEISVISVADSTVFYDFTVEVKHDLNLVSDLVKSLKLNYTMSASIEGLGDVSFKVTENGYLSHAEGMYTGGARYIDNNAEGATIDNLYVLTGESEDNLTVLQENFNPVYVPFAEYESYFDASLLDSEAGTLVEGGVKVYPEVGNIAGLVGSIFGTFDHLLFTTNDKAITSILARDTENETLATIEFENIGTTEIPLFDNLKSVSEKLDNAPTIDGWGQATMSWNAIVEIFDNYIPGAKTNLPDLSSILEIGAVWSLPYGASTIRNGTNIDTSTTISLLVGVSKTDLANKLVELYGESSLVNGEDLYNINATTQIGIYWPEYSGEGLVDLSFHSLEALGTDWPASDLVTQLNTTLGYTGSVIVPALEGALAYQVTYGTDNSSYSSVAQVVGIFADNTTYDALEAQVATWKQVLIDAGWREIAYMGVYNQVFTAIQDPTNELSISFQSDSYDHAVKVNVALARTPLATDKAVVSEAVNAVFAGLDLLIPDAIAYQWSTEGIYANINPNGSEWSLVNGIAITAINGGNELSSYAASLVKSNGWEYVAQDPTNSGGSVGESYIKGDIQLSVSTDYNGNLLVTVYDRISTPLTYGAWSTISTQLNAMLGEATLSLPSELSAVEVAVLVDTVGELKFIGKSVTPSDIETLVNGLTSEGWVNNGSMVFTNSANSSLELALIDRNDGTFVIDIKAISISIANWAGVIDAINAMVASNSGGASDTLVLSETTFPSISGTSFVSTTKLPEVNSWYDGKAIQITINGAADGALEAWLSSLTVFSAYDWTCNYFDASQTYGNPGYRTVAYNSFYYLDLVATQVGSVITINLSIY